MSQCMILSENYKNIWSIHKIYLPLQPKTEQCTSFVLNDAVRLCLTGIQIRFAIYSHINRFADITKKSFISLSRCQKDVFMEKILRMALVFLFVVTSSTNILARENGTVKKRFNWHPVMNAIIQVESEGNPQAVSGKSCGAMQISPIMVEECNQILEKRNSKKRFTLDDRFNVQKSKEMFILIQLHYNPTNNVEKAIRSWNGGQRYSVKATQRYYNKVMKLLK